MIGLHAQYFLAKHFIMVHRNFPRMNKINGSLNASVLDPFSNVAALALISSYNTIVLIK